MSTGTETPRAFGLGTFEREGDRFAGLVLLGQQGERVGDELVIDLRPYLGPQVTTGGLLADWDVSLARLRELAGLGDGGQEVAISELRPLPPVFPSGQVLCAGANFYRHTTEMTFAMLRSDPDERRDDDELLAAARKVGENAARSGRPFVFSAQPSALAGAYDDVVLWGPGIQHDWELELAVVIGKPARAVSPEVAMEHVAGYTICNDVSTRDVMFRPGFVLSDFLVSKNRPTFFPLGPYLVPTEFVGDYHDLRIELSVNGDVMQDDTLEDLIFGLEELVSYASGVCDLFPGDVLLTGSPAGNAAAHGNRWLRAGDVMEGRISGLGRQRNRCVAEVDARPLARAAS